MKLIQTMPVGSNLVFKDDFRSLRETTDQNGIVVASTIDRGVSPTGVSGKITYNGTESLLINSTTMTVRLSFKLQSTGLSSYQIVARSTATDMQWAAKLTSGTRLDFHVAASAADTSTYVYMNAPLLTLGGEYTAHLVFNGALTAASRALIYINGFIVSTSIASPIPTILLPSVNPVTAFTGLLNAPPNDFVLRSFSIWKSAFSASEVLADYNNTQYLVTP